MYERIIDVLNKKVQKEFIPEKLLKNYSGIVGTANKPKKRVTPRMLELIRSIEGMVNEFAQDMDSKRNKQGISNLKTQEFDASSPDTSVKITTVNSEFRFVVKADGNIYIVPDRVEDLGRQVEANVFYADTKYVLEIVSALHLFFNPDIYSFYGFVTGIIGKLTFFRYHPRYHSISYLPTIAAQLVRRGVA